jgi:hypothetical protein
VCIHIEREIGWGVEKDREKRRRETEGEQGREGGWEEETSGM